MTAAFTNAFMAAGLSGSRYWLRHTFAMTMLVRLQHQARSTPDLIPLKIVQVLLGHRSIQSTAIYLRCVELNADELAASMEPSRGGQIINTPPHSQVPHKRSHLNTGKTAIDA